ncbi:B-cell receptor CD22-like isoform X6 [Trachinotus anak]|uniref:B-cell receptor CD22-like isoform X6 n=1 Tax=Trachinotus anak TaxID=443729 RepID=UPI0039F179C7
MGLTAAARGFVLLFLSVSVLQSKTDAELTYISAQICAVRGSTVDIRCAYRQPRTVKRRSVTVEKILWFTETQDEEPVDLREDPEYTDRVKYYCDETTCTLRIADLRDSDSAEYKFIFKNKQNRRFTNSPGVTLSVIDPDLQVQVTRSYSLWAKLVCSSSCLLPDRPSYIWYKNGQKIQEQTFFSYADYFDPADSVSCAVKGHEDSPSPTVCVSGQSCSRVTYSDRRICASKGSSVDISCTYNSHRDDVESKLWFSPERSRRWQNPSQPEDLSEDSQYSGRVQVLETERGRSTLRITDLRERDSAQYHFKFKTPSFEWRSSLPGTTLTVTALQVLLTRVTTAHITPSHTVAELNCHSSCRPAALSSFVWFINGEKTQETSSSYTHEFYPGDNVTCAFRGYEDYRSPPVYPPKLPSVSVSPSGEIVEGSSVTLTCSSDANPAAKYTWYKENQTLLQGPEGVYHFSSISFEDRGIYHCKSENQFGHINSSTVSVDVQYRPKLPSVAVSPSGEVVEGSSVNLTCSSDANPAANYTWYKENQTLLQGPEGVYHFTSISSKDTGFYCCKCENQYGKINSSSLHVDVQYAPKTTSSSVSPSGEIVEGSSVTLTCSSDANPAANYTWYKENQTLPQGPERVYHFSSISSEDRGIYHCRSENQYGQLNSSSLFVDVQYPPKLPSVSVSPSGEIVEGSSVTLTCSSDANPAANYTWYKENENSPKASGQIFTITDFRPEHSGNYYCEAQNTRGRHNSTLNLVVVAGSSKSAAAGSITVILLAIIFISAFLLIRRKRQPPLSVRQHSEPGERPDNTDQINASPDYENSSAAVQIRPSEQQDGLLYSTVTFCKNQEDPLYSNVRLAQPNRPNKEEEENEEGVDYTTVNVNASPRLRHQEDPCALYSTVSKKYKV